MITNRSTIEIESMASADQRCRFTYTKIWERNKPKALFILMNPSKGTELKIDNTIVNINNYCVDNGFGSFRIVNLFPFRATDPKELVGNTNIESERNMEVISNSIDEFDVVIIAWGTEKKFIRKKREVEQLLISKALIPSKVLCWQDNKSGDYPKHLRILADDWKQIPYKAIHVKSTVPCEEGPIKINHTS